MAGYYRTIEQAVEEARCEYLRNYNQEPTQFVARRGFLTDKDGATKCYWKLEFLGIGEPCGDFIRIFLGRDAVRVFFDNSMLESVEAQWKDEWDEELAEEQVW